MLRQIIVCFLGITIITATNRTIAFSGTLKVPGDFPTIQQAIDAAVAGDVVLVGPGTYVENLDFLGKAITVKGDQGPQVTVIDGNKKGNTVRFVSNEDASSILTGFTVVNGFEPTLLKGGGIYCENASPTIEANIIKTNEASFGGGICCWKNASPKIICNTFLDNSASSGGGLYCGGGNSSPSILQNTFTMNSSVWSGLGGAAICCCGSSPIIEENTIEGNLGGGGISCTSKSSPAIRYNSISKNIGGGIYCWNSSAPTIAFNLISDHSFIDEYGGGIRCSSGSSPLITRNIIRNNSSYGHSVMVGGGIDCYDCSATIVSNTITGNTGDPGGGIQCSFCEDTVTITDNLIEGNFSNSGHYFSGAIYCENSDSIVISGNTITENACTGILCHCCSPPPGKEGDYTVCITDNHIVGNSERGVCLDLSYAIVRNNRITNHTNNSVGAGISSSSAWWSTNKIVGNIITENSSNFGGGICCYTAIVEDNLIFKNSAIEEGGGIGFFSESYHVDASRLSNNMIYDNQAQCGGGLYLSGGGSLSFSGNTLVGNTAHSGGGIAVHGNTLVMANSILWKNDASIGPEMWIDQSTVSSTVNVSFSDIEGGTASVHVGHDCTLDWGVGMIISDPLFVNPTSGDYHLTFLSPCRGSGNNYAVGLHACDFEGDPRIAQGTVDMGADEFYPHLYIMGDKSPGGSIAGKFVGLPGSAPVGLFISAGTISPPIPTLWGEFHLQFPVHLVELGAIPSDGILVIPTTCPSSPPPPYDVPMQALIGLGAESLTNLCVLEVR